MRARRGVQESFEITLRSHEYTKNDRNRRSRQALKLRKQAKKATSRRDKRMQRTQLRLNPLSVYSIGEKVYMRLRGKPSNKKHVTEDRIEKRKIKLHTYKVSYGARWDLWRSDHAICSSKLV